MQSLSGITSTLLFLGLTLSLTPSLLAGDSGKTKPNILFIMADDMGKEWVSCYGAEGIQTPNIDALAKGGMKFDKAWSMPQCTPSRATLLTGTYPWRNGFVNHWDVPRWGVGYLDWKHPRNTTFARLMKKAGYSTFASGKWQLNDFRLEPHAMKKHGFDDWAMWTGYEADNSPSRERYADPYINTPEGSKTYPGAFGPDVYTDKMISFMKRNRNKPMCLYYAMALPHGPMVPTPDEPKVEGKVVRYGAMVRYVDKMVGKLVTSLEELGLRENTLVIFTTDNGSPGVTGRRLGRDVRGGKSKKWEAGVCNPFIANWPGTVPAGTESDALTDFSDLLPTFVDIAGVTPPSDLVLDGHSILPVLKGKNKDTPREWIMAMGHWPARLDQKGVHGVFPFASRVIRDDRFKVWVDNERSIEALYDLEQDPWEEKNLIESQQPEHLASLNKFRKVVASFPKEDARPLYTPRSPNIWDKKPGDMAKKAKAMKARRAKKEKERLRKQQELQNKGK